MSPAKSRKILYEVEFVPNTGKLDKAMAKYSKVPFAGAAGGGMGAGKGAGGGGAGVGLEAALGGGIGAAIGAILGPELTIISKLLEGIMGGFDGVMTILGMIGKLLGMMVMPFANLLIPLLIPVLQLLMPVVRVLNQLLRPIMQKMMAAMKTGGMAGGVAGALGGLTEVVTALFGGVMKLMNEMMMNMFFTPMQAMIIVIGGAIGALVGVFDPQKADDIYRLTASVVGFLDGVKTLEIGTFNAVVDGITTGISMGVEGITKLAAGALDFKSTTGLLVSLATDFNKDFGKYVSEAIINADKQANSLLAKFGEDFVNTIGQMVDKAEAKLKKSSEKATSSEKGDFYHQMGLDSLIGSNLYDTGAEDKLFPGYGANSAPDLSVNLSDAVDWKTVIPIDSLAKATEDQTRVLSILADNLESSGQNVSLSRMEDIGTGGGPGSGREYISKEATDSWWSQNKQNDFIMRPGQAPVPFSADDTITGMKGSQSGQTIEINMPISVSGGSGGLTPQVINQILREIEVRLQSKKVTSGGFIS